MFVDRQDAAGVYRMMRSSVLLAVVGVVLASEPAYSRSADAQQQQLQRIAQNDTLDASPWALEFMRSWHADSSRAFCVVAYASWQSFVYIKTMVPAESADAPCATAQTPLYFQLPTCPQPPFQVEREHGPWIIVQCAADFYKRYLRSTPSLNQKASPKKAVQGPKA